MEPEKFFWIWPCWNVVFSIILHRLYIYRLWAAAGGRRACPARTPSPSSRTTQSSRWSRTWPKVQHLHTVVSTASGCLAHRVPIGFHIEMMIYQADSTWCLCLLDTQILFLILSSKILSMLPNIILWSSVISRMPSASHWYSNYA